MTRLKRIPELKPAQREASDPRHHASVSASAGTGKTHVLTARVLRLLLSGVDPASILCLTFTKAGAAEMAERLNSRLADWVRLSDPHLRHDLFHLGENNDPDTIAFARTLFARVLEARGGGPRILTIHAFAQSLLAGFPAEAGMLPGFTPLGEREEGALARTTLAAMLVDAERGGDLGLLRDVEALSHRLGERDAEKMLMACARAPEAMAAFGSREAIAPKLRRALGVPEGDVDAELAARCHDDSFDLDTLDKIAAANAAWSATRGAEYAEAIGNWRSLSCEERAAALHTIRKIVHTREGGVRAGAGQLKIDPDYAEHAARLGDACAALLDLRAKAALADSFAAALRAGQAFALAYSAAKRAGGFVDFDDLIRNAEALLLQPGIGEWVRYKLDQETDHILVDEAQDTNESQWNIVRALAGEYFAGEGAVRRHRTLFTVGDYKQAIFSFQGTDPAAFDVARRYFERQAHAADQEFRDVSLDTSFRSSPPILALVDQLLADVGREGLGLPDAAHPHDSVHVGRGGSVTLWPPVTADAGEDELGEEGWVPDATRILAGKIARQVAAWLGDPPMLASRGRPVRPEDILILVRNRGSLASLLVARLLQESVPVAGVDRLRLDAPLAVQDLLAAARFAVQPNDDLNLAALLVSPLLGWSQEQLLELAYGREGTLWSRLRAAQGLADAIQSTSSELRDILAMADYATPHAFFETVLSSQDGRRKLLARLGPETLDPIEELLSSALDFEADGAASLDAFLAWFSRGEVSIKRDPSAPLDAVRVMTVHGAKGLQSPIIILADATGDPDTRRGTFINIRHPDHASSFPLFRPPKDQLFEPLKALAEAADRREREEHGRLLYVALTRAEEHLYIGGALGPKARGVPPLASWYLPVEEAIGALGAVEQEDALWGATRRYDGKAQATGTARARERRPLPVPALRSLSWLRSPAPPEARPPLPLVPSSLGPDDAPDPPPSPAMPAAARRGSLLHALFERLPAVAVHQRRVAGAAWLSGSAGVTEADERDALLNAALGIIDDPRFAEIFGPDALAEAPLAAVLPDGTVVTGTVDRLLVTPKSVSLVDFKTGRSAPSGIEEVPPAYLRQIRAYVAALEVIFPGRDVHASLLFTSGPALIPVTG